MHDVCGQLWQCYLSCNSPTSVVTVLPMLRQFCNSPILVMTVLLQLWQCCDSPTSVVTVLLKFWQCCNSLTSVVTVLPQLWQSCLGCDSPTSVVTVLPRLWQLCDSPTLLFVIDRRVKVQDSMMSVVSCDSATSVVTLLPQLSECDSAASVVSLTLLFVTWPGFCPRYSSIRCQRASVPRTQPARVKTEEAQEEGGRNIGGRQDTQVQWGLCQLDPGKNNMYTCL